MFFIYGLIDTSSRELFYIGRTQYPQRRLIDHIKAVRGTNGESSGRKVKARINACVSSGHKPEMVVLERTADKTRERDWIEFFVGRAPLLNTADRPKPIRAPRPVRVKKVRMSRSAASRARCAAIRAKHIPASELYSRMGLNM